MSDKDREFTITGTLARVGTELTQAYEDAQRAMQIARVQREIAAFRDSAGGFERWNVGNDHFPSLRFRMDRYPGTLTVWHADRKLQRLHVAVAITNPYSGTETMPFPMVELCSISMLNRVIRSPRLSKLHLRDSVLDSAFVCMAQEEHTTRKLFTPEARKLLMDLYYRVPPHTLYMGLENDRLVLKRIFDLPSFEQARVMELAESARYLISAFSAYFKVEAVDPELNDLITAIVSEEDATCRVCGEQVMLERVRCSTCDTMHHRDCWEYTGHCAMYACFEEKFKEA